jgi:hypothetical protein
MVTAYVRGVQYGRQIGIIAQNLDLAVAEALGGNISTQIVPKSYLTSYLKAGVTCKHFAAYSLEQDGQVSRLQFNALVSKRCVQRPSLLVAIEIRNKPILPAKLQGCRTHSLAGICMLEADNASLPTQNDNARGSTQDNCSLCCRDLDDTYFPAFKACVQEVRCLWPPMT